MRKPLVLLIFLTMLSLVALQILTYKPPTEAYLALQDQFETYLAKDLNTDDNFVNYLNNLELEHALENVKITVVYNLEETTLSGFIVFIDDANVYVVTQSDYFPTFGINSIQIYDYKNRSETGRVVARDTTNHLALIKFHASNYDDLKEISYASTIPLENEIISSISNNNYILNHISLGIFGTLLENEMFYDFEMENSSQAIGSSIYDINLSLIGIRLYIDDQYVMLQYSDVKNFVELYV
ncbi:MAG: hypothetical protein WCR19_00775 [Acholeplasmataceae bacterium]